MNILITGGCGYIGSNLCNYLYDNGHNITALDCNIKQKFYISNKINIIEKNILQISPKDLDGIDHVFHLAALPRIGMSFTNSKDFFLVNTQGTIIVLEACRKNKCSLSFISSSSCDSCVHLNPYSCSKQLAETACKMYQESFLIPLTITRLFNVYGKNHLRYGKKACLIGLIEQSIINKKQMTIYGSGEQRRDFTHIDDICVGLSNLIAVNCKEVIDLGFGKNYSINEIIEMFQIRNLKKLPKRKGEGNNTLANVKRTRNYIDWKPKISINEYINHFLKNINK